MCLWHVVCTQALRALLSFVLAPSGPNRPFLGLPDATAGSTVHVPHHRMQTGHCTMPTDVALGWLMTRTFANRNGLHVVNLFGLFELLVW